MKAGRRVGRDAKEAAESRRSCSPAQRAAGPEAGSGPDPRGPPRRSRSQWSGVGVTVSPQHLHPRACVGDQELITEQQLQTLCPWVCSGPCQWVVQQEGLNMGGRAGRVGGREGGVQEAVPGGWLAWLLWEVYS